MNFGSNLPHKYVYFQKNLFSFDQVGISFFRSEGVYGVLTIGKGQAASGFAKNLPASLRSESIFRKNLVRLNPYIEKAPETKMTDPTERRIKKMSDKREADKN